MTATQLLYSRDEAAAMLAAKPTRIDELRRAGRLIAVRDGRAYKYRIADLTAYVESLDTWEPA